MRKYIIAGFLITVCFLCQGYDFSSEGVEVVSNDEIILTVKAEQMIYRLEAEPVNLNVYIANNSEEPLEIIEPAIDRRSLFVEILSPDGKTDNMVAIYGLNLKTIRLMPGKRVKYLINFTPEIQGEFIIKVYYNGFGDKPIEASPVTVFVVSPR